MGTTMAFLLSWWRHQIETFSALLVICEGNPPVIGGFPSQRPVTRSFGVFFDLRQNKRSSKQSRGRWFETPLWRLCNVIGRLAFSQWQLFVNYPLVTIFVRTFLTLLGFRINFHKSLALFAQICDHPCVALFTIFVGCCAQLWKESHESTSKSW